MLGDRREKGRLRGSFHSIRRCARGAGSRCPKRRDRQVVARRRRRAVHIHVLIRRASRCGRGPQADCRRLGEHALRSRACKLPCVARLRDGGAGLRLDRRAHRHPPDRRVRGGHARGRARARLVRRGVGAARRARPAAGSARRWRDQCPAHHLYHALVRPPARVGHRAGVERPVHRRRPLAPADRVRDRGLRLAADHARVWRRQRSGRCARHARVSEAHAAGELGCGRRRRRDRLHRGSVTAHDVRPPVHCGLPVLHADGHAAGAPGRAVQRSGDCAGARRADALRPARLGVHQPAVLGLALRQRRRALHHPCRIHLPGGCPRRPHLHSG